MTIQTMTAPNAKLIAHQNELFIKCLKGYDRPYNLTRFGDWLAQLLFDSNGYFEQSRFPREYE